MLLPRCPLWRPSRASASASASAALLSIGLQLQRPVRGRGRGRGSQPLTAHSNNKMAATNANTAARNGTNDARRGVFILFEGLDRSGKSTQCERLVSHLNQQQPNSAMHYRFPNRTTTIGKMINQYLSSSATDSTVLDDHTIHLLFSANRWEAKQAIEQTLNSGQHVVCDRYIYSGIAFSAAKGLDFEWCYAPDVGLPAADVILFIDISTEVAQARGGYGQERYETQEMQTAVRQVFKRLEKTAENWQTVDGSGSVEEVSQKVQAIVPQEIAKHQYKPIQTVQPIAT